MGQDLEEECSNCFCVYSVPGALRVRHPKLPLCDYCKNEPAALTREDVRIERIMEVSDRTYMYRFPEILKIVYYVLNKKIENLD